MRSKTLPFPNHPKVLLPKRRSLLRLHKRLALSLIRSKVGEVIQRIVSSSQQQITNFYNYRFQPFYSEKEIKGGIQRCVRNGGQHGPGKYSVQRSQSSPTTSSHDSSNRKVGSFLHHCLS